MIPVHSNPFSENKQVPLLSNLNQDEYHQLAVDIKDNDEIDLSLLDFDRWYYKVYFAWSYLMILLGFLLISVCIYLTQNKLRNLELALGFALSIGILLPSSVIVLAMMNNSLKLTRIALLLMILFLFVLVGTFSLSRESFGKGKGYTELEEIVWTYFMKYSPILIAFYIFITVNGAYKAFKILKIREELELSK